MTLFSGAERIWLVGCGNMGSAILRGWITDGRAAHSILVIDPQMPALPEGVVGSVDVPSTAAPPDILMLCIKPQQLATVAPMIANRLNAGTLLLSVLAGVEVASLRALLPIPQQVVRAMPNLPAMVGAGVTALYSNSTNEVARARATALVSGLGTTEWIVNEAHFDAITALSGCGPAFVFRFIAALAQAGAALGLPPEQAMRLAQATVSGSAALVAQSNESVAQLADRVASPGGSTRAGLNVLDADAVLNQLMLATLQASVVRNTELAVLARDAINA